jgi:ribosomal-protein-alanine N-acetyltransferase
MELRTDRLFLREFVPADWEAVHAYQNDPLYLRYYAWTGRSEAEVRSFLERFIDHQSKRPRRKFQLAITLAETGDLIGNCGIRRKPDNDWGADIGFELAPKHWGRGIATEAARAVVAHGFDEMGLHRISAECVADNIGSARVLEKAGLHLEGRLRENEYYKDRWWDTLLYGALVTEYEMTRP